MVSNNIHAVDLLMVRAEGGHQHADDAQVLFEAIKSAAQQHTSEADMLKFVVHHISCGYQSFYEKKRKQEH